MEEVKVITSWSNCGLGRVEQMVSEQMKPGEIQGITGRDIVKLIKLKNDADGNFSKVELNKEIEEKKTYHIYYNYHPSSGFKTEIKKDAAGFKTDIIRPRGGVLCAFFSEIIIFES